MGLKRAHGVLPDDLIDAAVEPRDRSAFLVEEPLARSCASELYWLSWKEANLSC